MEIGWPLIWFMLLGFAALILMVIVGAALCLFRRSRRIGLQVLFAGLAAIAAERLLNLIYWTAFGYHVPFQHGYAWGTPEYHQDLMCGVVLTLALPVVVTIAGMVAGAMLGSWLFRRFV